MTGRWEGVRHAEGAGVRFLAGPGLILLLFWTRTPCPVSHSDEVKELFNFGYDAYMNHAYPADELMPLSCKGRYRGVDPSRGDIDDALGK